MWADPDENAYIFQFTTSQGGRRNTDIYSQAAMDLSIHDLTRRSTVPAEMGVATDTLSIHDLTRRSTFLVGVFTGDWDLSIHDLTRRSTCSTAASETVYYSFNSRPHKEVDLLSSLPQKQSSIFQFTTSQGGRPV